MYHVMSAVYIHDSPHVMFQVKFQVMSLVMFIIQILPVHLGIISFVQCHMPSNICSSNLAPVNRYFLSSYVV